MATTPATWPVGRSIRAGVGVATPLLIGTLLDNPAMGMWVSMGVLLSATGERSVAYVTRFRQLAIVAPVAASAYLLGFVSAWPPVLIIALMTLLAFASGIVSGISSPLSVASMQALLIGAIAIGVPEAAPYWPAALLFLGGCALHAALLAAEAAIMRKRPERDALVALLNALAALAASRKEGAAAPTPARAAAVAALDGYLTIAVAQRGRAQGPTREFTRAGAIARAADQLLARLIAHDAVPALCAATAVRLTTVSTAVARGQHPAPRDDTTLVRVEMLERAIFGAGRDERDERDERRESPARPAFSLPGRGLLAVSARLSLCTALAYAAWFTLPISHGYWIPLTVALVMKPDLGSVFARAVLRAVGTVGGAVLAMVIGLAAGVPFAFIVAVGLLAAVLPWAKARSYALQALVLTPLIMLMLGMTDRGATPGELTIERIATTVIGSAIVIVAGYLPWPSARHVHIAEHFEASLQALSAYADDVAGAASPAQMFADRRTAYRSLSDARVALQRVLAEPPPAGPEAWAWLPVIAAAERVADRLTDASASLPPIDVSGDGAALRALAGEIAALTAAAPTAEVAHTPTPSDQGADAADASIRELADEIATLRPMLERTATRAGGR